MKMTENTKNTQNNQNPNEDKTKKLCGDPPRTGFKTGLQTGLQTGLHANRFRIQTGFEPNLPNRYEPNLTGAFM